jgi:hypothetical protein
LNQEHHDTKRELDRLKQLCAKNQIDTPTRKQKEEPKAERCAVKSSEAYLSTGTPRIQRPRPFPTTRQPALMLRPIQALSHEVATPAYRFTRCASGFPVEDQHLWLRVSGYCIPREFVQTYYGGSKKRLVQDKDVEFVIQDLSKGDSLGSYVSLWPHGSNFLSRERVHTQASGKHRMVNNYHYLNSFCKKQTCRYRRASQGSLQASTTPRLVAQSRRQRSVLACPVTSLPLVA